VSRWTSTEAGSHLSGRRSKDTAPEIALRKSLHALGARFRLHRKLGPRCTPDIVLVSRRIAVFVDGCFWHGCPKHGKSSEWTGPNAELWREKLERTQLRDMEATVAAEGLGWTVVRVWECAVKADADSVARSILCSK
jgi:DNA mismatch endonuclease (patch repair protein)